MLWTEIIALLHYAVAVAVAIRVLLRQRMAPTARLAWVLVVVVLPVMGIFFYLMFGEVRMRHADRQRMADVRAALSHLWDRSPDALETVPDFAAAAVASARATGGMDPVGGNRLTLLEEGDAALDHVVAAVDAARDHVHLLFYIWLPDHSGTRLAEAAIRAARRGVDCRVIVDDLGSRRLIRSILWGRMQEAGVRCVNAFPIGNPLTGMLLHRLDLRNHRKIAVIDNVVGFTGSRNCADMAFAVKPRFAPWIDILLRIEGPVLRQLQAVFLQDWMSYTGNDLGELLDMVAPVDEPGQVAQVVASGPDLRRESLSDSIATMIHASRQRLTITTPYYVPDDAIDAAIRSAARRGVSVTMILPERNDSRIVAATSEGFYQGLLKAGVRVMLFRGGLLHAKIVTVDGRMAIAGSANLDRRSFDLNYEVNLLVVDEAFTADLDERQASYIVRSRRLTLAEVDGWGPLRRIRNNTLALAAPLI